MKFLEYERDEINENKNNLSIPSRQGYQNFVYFHRNGGEIVTYQNIKWTKSNVLNPNGSFLLHIFVLHFIRGFLDLKNEPIRNQNNICKRSSCFKDYDDNSAFQCFL